VQATPGKRPATTSIFPFDGTAPERVTWVGLREPIGRAVHLMGARAAQVKLARPPWNKFPGLQDKARRDSAGTLFPLMVVGSTPLQRQTSRRQGEVSLLGGVFSMVGLPTYLRTRNEFRSGGFTPPVFGFRIWLL